MACQVRTQFLGHDVFAIDQFMDGAKLYVDGRVVDTAKGLSKKLAMLRGRIIEDNIIHIVEVYLVAKGWWDADVVIFIDDKEVARSPRR
jgi:hypothetical protein